MSAHDEYFARKQAEIRAIEEYEKRMTNTRTLTIAPASAPPANPEREYWMSEVAQWRGRYMAAHDVLLCVEEHIERVEDWATPAASRGPAASAACFGRPRVSLRLCTIHARNVVAGTDQ